MTSSSTYSSLPLTRKTNPIHNTIIDLGSLCIGDGSFTLIAGPCAVESANQINNIAANISKYGIHILRGGAFKPRTSPYDFQGLGEQGLELLRQAATTHKLLCISEVLSAEDVPLVSEYVDILQIGARNMQNFSLLKQIGQSTKPVVLKRGISATYYELLAAAEYILSAGNPHVILCERGIRSFDTHCRNTLDLAAVPILKQLTHLPVIIDPSHGTGRPELIAPMTKAALVINADGAMIEAHTQPKQSRSDAAQAISLTALENITKTLPPLAKAVDISLQ